MKYCLECGRIYSESYDEYENDNCLSCGMLLIEDKSMTEEQFLQLSEKQKDEYELKIYNICKQSEFFMEDEYNAHREDLSDWYLTFRFDKYEQLTGEKAWTKENDLYHTMKARQEVNDAVARHAGMTSGKSNVPKCPTCSSTNIQKIGGLERGASIAVFGLFSKKINKSFKCSNCGYTW